MAFKTQKFTTKWTLITRVLNFKVEKLVKERMNLKSCSESSIIFLKSENHAM
jgi:hypothetical protein